MADEEEAGRFCIFSVGGYLWPLLMAKSRRKQYRRSARAYNVQDRRHAVVSLPASKTFTS